MKKYKLYTQALERQEQSKKLQKQKIQEEQRRKQLPIPKIIPLKEQFNYTCHICNDYIIFDTLYLDDFTGKYIPLDPETVRTHHCHWKNVKK